MNSRLIRPSITQRVTARIHTFLLINRSWLLFISVGYLLGRVTNATSGPKIENFRYVYSNLFAASGSVNILLWISVFVLLSIPLLEFFVRYQKRHLRPEMLFDYLTQKRMESITAPFSRNVLSWGADVTLQLASDLQIGWCVKDVEVIFNGNTFSLPIKERSN